MKISSKTLERTKTPFFKSGTAEKKQTFLKAVTKRGLKTVFGLIFCVVVIGHY